MMRMGEREIDEVVRKRTSSTWLFQGSRGAAVLRLMPPLTSFPSFVLTNSPSTLLKVR